MPPMIPLPVNPGSGFASADDFVESLLSFVTSNELFQKLCGGVHILDFLTKEPDLYDTILPEDWRIWFRYRDVSEILDLLIREDLTYIGNLTWQEGCKVPVSLLDYVLSIRRHAFDRTFAQSDPMKDSQVDGVICDLPRHVSVGMKPKKIHEVQNFIKYIVDLADVDKSKFHEITQIIDFGSGQNYLGRALASPPHGKNVVALESKQHNIKGAKTMDVMAKLAEKEKFMRNKKEYRQGLPNQVYQLPHIGHADQPLRSHHSQHQLLHNIRDSQGEYGSIQYIEKLIDDGDLSNVIAQLKPPAETCMGIRTSEPHLMVVSLHSCGNLLHHGLRSLILNPAVKIVAMVGCCYNLVTERLGPPTYKLPSLRSSNLRLDQTSSACDPHGFPMSEKLATYQHQGGRGIRFNITARMMAVQAPENWTSSDCDSFFTRHFYRALLQRIFLDYGVVQRPVDVDSDETSPRGWTGAGPAICIGSLRKACYTSFTAYVRGAIAKLAEDPQLGPETSRLMKNLTDEEISMYEVKYSDKKKELSIIWSLMAFSASVVEAAIVVDRWLYLKEQDAVRDCWVETVFDYKQSPRNLVVVGIKH